MRVGTNPLKHQAVLPVYKRHRIIMPVYIPSEEGYFASAFEIFRMSFESLLASTDTERVSITIIDNACVAPVAAYIDRAVAEGKIDRLIRHAVNRGKPDAVAGELMASFEPYVTLADCDVLFLPGWLNRVEEVYAAWPAAGAVSPAGQPKTAFHANDTTWIYGAIRGQIKLGKYVEDADMRQFAHSVGNPALYTDRELARQFVLSSGGTRALIGGGHFVITLRRECYRDFAYQPRLEGTGHGMRAIDRQVDARGWLRLSTTRAYVLHLGNTPEPWMKERLQEVAAASVERLPGEDSAVLRRARPGTSWLPRFGVSALAATVKTLARVIYRYA